MRIWSDLGGRNGWTSGYRFSACPCSNFFRGKQHGIHLGAHVHGRLVPCLSRPVGIRRRKGDLDIRSPSPPLMLVPLADRAVAPPHGTNTMPIRCGTDGAGRWVILLVVGGGTRGTIIPSTAERRSVYLTARSQGEKRQDSTSANFFATDSIHSDKNWNPSSSSTFVKRRGPLIMSLLDATNAFITCTTLELSTQILNKYISYFFTRPPSVLMSTIRITVNSLTKMLSTLSFYSHIS
jgi:hypothetical protein